MKKNRLFREEVKDLHTSHWDLDMMSREELEATMLGTDKTGLNTEQKPETAKPIGTEP